MPAIRLTNELRDEYTRLFQSCRIRPAAAGEVTRWAERIAGNKPRYDAISAQTNVPWYVLGIMHYRECSCSFDRHLHNGDPLNARTVQEPKGCPRAGHPPFTFEESAIDALRQNRTSSWTDWSLPGTLYKLESYNGFGYRQYHPDVLSPYLWGQSNHYERGGYPRDRQWSDSYVNKQLGSAVILRRISELGHVAFDASGSPATGDGPASVWAPYASVKYNPKVAVPLARELQRALNNIPGIQLREDGKAGDRTSEAYRRVTGRYLTGDPRNA